MLITNLHLDAKAFSLFLLTDAAFVFLPCEEDLRLALLCNLKRISDQCVAVKQSTMDMTFAMRMERHKRRCHLKTCVLRVEKLKHAYGSRVERSFEGSLLGMNDKIRNDVDLVRCVHLQHFVRTCPCVVMLVIASAWRVALLFTSIFGSYKVIKILNRHPFVTTCIFVESKFMHNPFSI